MKKVKMLFSCFHGILARLLMCLFCFRGCRPTLFYVTHALMNCLSDFIQLTMVICLEQDANDLHMIQLMPLPPRRLLLH